MRVAIVGGGSCFALNLATHLHEAGIDHFGIGRSPKKPGPMWTVKHDYHYYRGHVVNDLKEILQLIDLRKPDVIVNIAAQGEGAASFGENAPDFFQTNCIGLIRLVLELQKRDYLCRFVQIGSSEIYGSVDHAAKETDPHRPGSPYGISKAAFDQYLGIAWRVHQFPMNIVLPSNAYCNGQQLHRIIPKTLLAGLSGKTVPLHGGGMAEKSYIHSSDLSRAIIKVLEKAPLGETYNCGPLWPTKIRTVVEHCAAACGRSFADLVEQAPERTGQDSRYWLNSGKLRQLGWEPKIDLADGINSVASWVKENLEALSQMSTDYVHKK